MTTSLAPQETGLASAQPAGRLQSIARRLDCTEGQLYTVVIGLAVAVPFAIFGIPPTLQEQPTSVATGVRQPLPPAVATPTPQPSAIIVPTPQPSFGPPGPNEGLITAPPISGPIFPEPTAGPTQEPSRPAADPPPGTITLAARVGTPGHPAGLAYLPDGSYTVTTNNDSSAAVVFTYGPNGQLKRRTAITGQPAGHKTGLVAAATSPSGQVVMLDASTNRILTASTEGVVATRATVPDVAPCLLTLNVQPCEQGLQDQPVVLSAVTVDKQGTSYIADAGQGIIWRLRGTDTAPTLWYSSQDVATGDGPAGLTFDRSGNLLFTTGTSLDTANPNNGSLYQLPLTSDGAAGTRTLLHPFASGERPGAVAVGASGTAYVIARGPGAIVSIDRAGNETGRVNPPGRGPVALDTPAGLAITEGRLLVTNEAPFAPENWAVLAIAVNDRA